jgi:hypothetical protein
MDYISVVLRVNGVLEENGPDNPKARNYTPHANLRRMKGTFMGFMRIFHGP